MVKSIDYALDTRTIRDATRDPRQCGYRLSRKSDTIPNQKGRLQEAAFGNSF
jgi:hypothetical protein